MDESRNLEPTAENTGPYHREMQVVFQELMERDTNSKGSSYDLADQASLQEYNVAVAKLEDRKRRAKATLHEDVLLEIDNAYKKNLQKLQALEADCTKEREDLEKELFKKSGRSFKKLQELHTKRLLQSQEFSERAKEILQRMSKSLIQENSISTLGSGLAISVTATGAAIDIPSTSSASESTMPVSRTERVIQDQSIVASPDDNQPLFMDSPDFEPRVPPPMGASWTSSPMAASLQVRPSPNDDHSINRQKTKALSSTSIKRETSPTMNDASYFRDPLDIHVPTQSLGMASDKPYGSHAQSWFPSVDTAGRYSSLGRENATILQNSSIPSISVSARLQPAHALNSLVNTPTLDVPSCPPAFEHIARQGYSSSQISRPLMSAPKKTLSNAGLPDDVSSMRKKQSTYHRKDQLTAPLKRKASDANLSYPYDDTEISKTGGQTQIQENHDEAYRVREVRPSATNPSSASGASRNWTGQAPQFGRQQAIKEESTSEVTGVSRSMNVEPAHMSSLVHQSSNVDAMQSRVLTPRNSNVGFSRGAVAGARTSSPEPFRPTAITNKTGIAEAELHFVLYIPIQYISYDAGAPSRSYPVTWAGTKGRLNPGRQFGYNYSLQVLLAKKGVLHPFDGGDNKSSKYPAFVVDGSWILGGFYHRESGNCRIEIYRPRSKKEYKAEVEEGYDRVEIQSARLRIVIAKESDLNNFVHCYKKLHPNAEIRADDRLGSLEDFHDENGDSDPTLREEIEIRAQRLALAAPDAVMTSA
ncbi:hypothetical protein BELL_0299g00080 [Botrytis elliptica]|uniref:Uncharacterized protein n=1 Tax=Botrytis elliptica TaxID=278938 RepID=A0A4Z1JZ40_9HELO|nr:hypothetical protein EAE99_010882 [Botrytis elliptica]TGO74217.1 hypothetical protein BELL_0299g00080 [Botrytis elliptica]